MGYIRENNIDANAMALALLVCFLNDILGEGEDHELTTDTFQLQNGLTQGTQEMVDSQKNLKTTFWYFSL